MNTLVHHRYILKDKLGAGSMGAVYLAHDRLSGDLIALKRVHPSTAADDLIDPVLSTQVKLSLTHEFEILASLRHPNVIKVLDYGIDEVGAPFFTMEYLQNAVTLHEAGRNRSFRDRIRLLMQVFEALKYLRRRGVIHRDLKPENIMVAPNDHVKVVDFGLALDQPKYEESGMTGTIAYMAPELLQGQPPSFASDMYSLGVITYELLTGQRLFGENKIFQLMRDILERSFDPQPLIDVIEAHSMEEYGLFDPAQTLILNKSTADAVQDITPNHDSVTSSIYPLVNLIASLVDKNPARRLENPDHILTTLYDTIGEPAPPQSADTRESYLQAASFVGREVEQKRLLDALTRASAGLGGSLWLISGESGVGKSRLLRELHSQALVHGALVLTGEARRDTGQPLQIWREPLRHLLLEVEVSDEDAAALRQLVPDIERILDRPVPPAVQDAPLADVIVRVLKAVQQPLLLLLEDIQWEFDESLNIVKLLEAEAPDSRWLITVSYRTDEAPQLIEMFPDVPKIQLERFGLEAIGSLIHAMIGQAGADSHLVAALQRQTEGNVFFLVETLRALAEDAPSLEAIGSAPIPERIITSGIQQIMQRRLDLVPVDLRPLLQTAAVAGRELDLLMMRALFDGAQVEHWLTTATNAAVLDYQNERWRFSHEKLREHLLEQLAAPEKRDLHRQVAEAIERIYPHEEYALLLVKHWREAETAAKELHYIRMAADRLKQIGIYNEARALYERALELATEDPRAEVEFNVLLGGVYEYLSRYEPAQASLNRALELSAQHEFNDFSVDILDTLAWIDIRHGNMDAASAKGEQVIALARASGDDKLLMRALGLIGVIQHIKGDMQGAYDAFAEALPLAEKAGQASVLANHLNSLGAAEAGIGKTEEAIATLTRASTLAQEIANAGLIGNVEGNLGRILYLDAQYDNAYEHFLTALIAFERAHNTYGEALSNCYMSFVVLRRSNLEEARERVCAALTLSTSIGATATAVMTLCAAADLHRQQGNIERAVALIGMVRAHPVSGSDAEIQTESDRVLARLHPAPIPEQLETWLAHGQTLDFDAVVEQERNTL